jgi:endonuclease/exonuclease/phosphatase family metal-dependent hydrolase
VPRIVVFRHYQERTGERRCMIKAIIRLPGNNDVSVYGTHLEVSDGVGTMREQQAQEIIQATHQDGNQNILITGDFNEVRREDCQYLVNGRLMWDLLTVDNLRRNDQTSTRVSEVLVRSNFQNCFALGGVQAPKFTTWNGTTVDFIYLKNGWNLPIIGCYSYYSAASDHLPIIMDVQIAP